jgi:hypothetical protein
MGDQSVARLLPAHSTAHKHRINTDINALSGIRTHDPSVQVSEDSSCLRPHGQCYQRVSVVSGIHMLNSNTSEVRPGPQTRHDAIKYKVFTLQSHLWPHLGHLLGETRKISTIIASL